MRTFWCLTTIWILLVCSIVTANAQKQIVITISSVPEYTPKKDSIFIAGDFNNWTLADSNYRFRALPDGSYRLVLRLQNKQTFDFKVNRGNWKKVEGNDAGGYIANHRFEYQDNIFEYQMEVKSWQDLHQSYYPSTTIRLLSLPANTPTDAKLYIGGSFNNWSSNDPEFQLKKAADKTYFVKVNTGLESFEYKFCRGSWEGVEARWDGGVKSNRVYVASSNKSEVVLTKIAAWEDLSQRLVFWKVSFTVLFIQLLLFAFVTTRISKARYLLFFVGIFAFAFASRYLHSDSLYAAHLPKLRLFSPWALSFICLPMHIWLSKTYNKKVNFEWFYVLPALPFVVLVYFWSVSNEKFNMLIIDNIISQVNMALYSYATFVNLLILYKNNRLQKIHTHKIPKLALQVFSTLRNAVYIQSILLFVAFCAELTPLDPIWINDWYENFSWLLFGGFLIYAQILSLQELHVLFSDNAENKRSKESVSDKQLTVLKNKLVTLMEEKHIYTNSKLNLSELARIMGSNTHYVSKLINEDLGVSFTDYINAFRVKAIIQEIENSDNNQTFLYVALKMGFNSKSSFNRAFKKVTLKTPSEYFVMQR